jgi:hypothetical protein
MKKVFSTIAVFSFICSTLIAQTSAYGNYEVYTHESTYKSLGYSTITLKLPEYLGDYEIVQKGIMYHNRYNMGEIAAINFTDDARFRLLTQGSFRFGLALGSTSTDTLVTGFNSVDLKYYSATLDFFSFSITPEITYVFENGIGVTAQLGFDLLNFGATISILNKGKFKDHAIGHVNFAPFAMRPSLFFDFGRRGLGIAFYINPYNVGQYLYASPKLFKGSDRGVLINSSTIKKFAFEILFVL